LIFVEGENLSASFVGGNTGFQFFFAKSKDPKGQIKFEQTPDIPPIARDSLAYCVTFCSFSILV
jgi:hypothetical protein